MLVLYLKMMKENNLQVKPLNTQLLFSLKLKGKFYSLHSLTRIRIDEAIEIVKRMGAIHEKLKQDHDVHKTYLSLIVLHLYRDDYVAADKCYQDGIRLL